MPLAPADQHTQELPVTPPPPRQPPRGADAERRGRLAPVVIGLLVVLLVGAAVWGAWQARAAAEAESRLAELGAQVAELEADRSRLEAENRRLRDQVDRAPQRDAPTQGGPEGHGTDAPDGPSIWERDLDRLRDELEEQLDDLADELGRGLRDLLGTG